MIEMAASTDLDDVLKTLAESKLINNPDEPRLIQAARILDYCRVTGKDLETKLIACDTGTAFHAVLLVIITNATNISASQKFQSYNATDMVLFA